jgi:hypothetical protein
LARTSPTALFAHLQTDQDYLVIRAFRDFDGGEHAEGEVWTFIGSSFLPYEDGLSLFVMIDGTHRQVRMQWRNEEQGPIIDRLADYLQLKQKAAPYPRPPLFCTTAKITER